MKKVGYAEIFSSFSESYVKLVPTGADNRSQFYKTLVTSVAMAQIENESLCNKIAVKCLRENVGLRRVRTLIEMHNHQ